MAYLVGVFNRRSQSGKVAALLPAITATLERLGIAYNLVDLGAANFDQQLADLVRSEPTPSAILGIGGDGTHHAVLNRLLRLQREWALRLPPYALCPFGTGNDLAKSLGLPLGVRNLARVLRIAVTGQVQALDVGTVEDRCFVDVVSVGLDAEILHTRDRFLGWLDRRPLLGRLVHGYLVYAAAVPASLCALPRPRGRLTVDGQVWHEGPVLNLLLNNCRIHAGEFDLTPAAAQADGRLDAVVFPGLAGYALRYLRGYRFLPDWLQPGPPGPAAPRPGRGAAYVQGAQFEIELAAPLPVQVDGEFLGRRQRLSIGILPRAIGFRTPGA